MYSFIEIPYNYFSKSYMRTIIFDKQLNYNFKERRCHKAQEHMEAQ